MACLDQSCWIKISQTWDGNSSSYKTSNYCLPDLALNIVCCWLRLKKYCSLGRSMTTRHHIGFTQSLPMQHRQRLRSTYHQDMLHHHRPLQSLHEAAVAVGAFTKWPMQSFRNIRRTQCLTRTCTWTAARRRQRRQWRQAWWRCQTIHRSTQIGKRSFKVLQHITSMGEQRPKICC